MKYYTSEDVQFHYTRFSYKKREQILLDALEIMQSYNNRSVFDCIAIALGYQNYEGTPNTYTKKNNK